MNAIFARPLPKLIAVVAVQILILLAILAFKQYTLWTADTVVLVVDTDTPATLVGDDTARVSYEISTVDLSALPGDDSFMHSVYVELREQEDGTWQAVALHVSHKRSFDGTILIKSEIATYYPRPGYDTLGLRYGIEDIYIPNDAAAGLPTDSGHTITLEVKVDRFGNARPQRFLIDGEPFDVAQR